MTQRLDPPPTLWQRRPLRLAVRNWLERHQNPVNFWIHLVGIPLALAGIVLFFVMPWEQWYWALAALVGGYALQFIGHRVEGNDMGEWAGIKRLLGRPYVAIASPPYEGGVGGGGLRAGNSHPPPAPPS